ncbi:phytanoyl-CoA dioxygenase family protein [Cohnella silvisoli]|uniref:Phytanoyl-CoA dioxygenase family protein n=1 Tax=Cohnella silvisoli TaxID=2873699 RepID=A0ABV1L374_9BACL|nr:phytanoyl-CoA dioxygenase family protein [Cohnella silvisoli]MCD9025397.1 phytanoyl-CoA dioxygenase family protein [Cohnella silvisoli]
MSIVSVTLKENYDKDGYIKLNKVLDDDLVMEAKAHIDWLMTKHPHLRPEHLYTGTLEMDPFWHRLISDDRLLDIAEQFIGPDIALFASGYISKPPFDGRMVPWHQDGAFWPLEPMNVVSLWLAVDDSTTENGCLRVIPGTQNLELKAMNAAPMNAVFEQEVDPKYVDETKAVDLELKAGGVSIHNPLIIHGSNANLSPNRRCGLTIRYIPTTTRIISDKQWTSAYLLRGEARPGINEYMPKPKYVPGEHMAFRGSESYR